MKRRREQDRKDPNPARSKRARADDGAPVKERIMRSLQGEAQLDNKSLLDELLIPAAARAAAVDDVAADKCIHLVIPNADRKLPWSSSDQCELNVQLLDYLEALFGVIDRWLNEGTCPGSVRWSGGQGPALHLQFLRDWLLNCYVLYRDSGRGSLCTSAMVFYARSRLYYAQHRLQRFPDGSALEKCTEASWREHAWTLFFDCVFGCAHSKTDWLRKLDAFERETVIVVTYSSSQKLCEDAAANYAWMQLQMEYLLNRPDMDADERKSLLDSVSDVRARVRAWVDSVIKRQISDVFDNMLTDFVHAQYLACGLVDIFARDNESIGKRLPMSAQLDGTLKVKDREKMQSMLAENPADVAADEKHPLNGLLRFVSMVYCIEQQYNIKWLPKYFISNKEFNTRHGELSETRRGLPERRPTVCFTLGRACVYYKGTHKAITDTPEDAFLLWYALVKRDYGCKLEYGCTMEDFGQM